ncbi:MAG: hypothetical protein DVB32_03245 [Verrucomicrobia bacterium]|nr:MAG: hypothetical protein DVB32_03245 [Verrucomicrobiota bacterium]
MSKQGWVFVQDSIPELIRLAELSFFSLTERLSQISEQSDPLEQLNAVIDWQIFQPVLDRVFPAVAPKGPGVVRPIPLVSVQDSGSPAFLPTLRRSHPIPDKAYSSRNHSVHSIEPQTAVGFFSNFNFKRHVSKSSVFGSPLKANWWNSPSIAATT